MRQRTGIFGDFWMKRVVVFLVLVGLLVGSIVNTRIGLASDKMDSFADVDRDEWFYADVQEAAKKGYAHGYPDGTFRPYEPITPAEFVTMLLYSFTTKDSEGTAVWSEETLAKIIPVVKKYKIDNYRFPFELGEPWHTNFTRISFRLGMLNEFFFKNRLEEPMTREDAAEIVDSSVGALFDNGIYDNVAEKAAYLIPDYEKLTPEFKLAVVKTALRGIMIGDTGGNFNGARYLSRAEAIAIIERINQEEKRIPLKFDISIYPYSMVRNDYLYTEGAYIFSSFRMKSVYDDLVERLKSSSLTYDISGQTINIYKDEKMKEDLYNLRSHWTGANKEIYSDIGFVVDTYDYSIVIHDTEGRFEEYQEIIDAFLQSILSKSEVINEVRTLLDSSVRNFEKGSLTKYKKVIGKFEISINQINESKFMAMNIKPVD